MTADTPTTAGTPTTVYTDGACLGNPGPGGWAWAVPGGRYASGAEPRSTNQRMEIMAALEAARAFDGALEIVSDSTYIVNCFRDRWWEGWIARGWRNKSKQPVANRDLWEPLIDLYRARPDRFSFRWVKGHSNEPMNDLVDRLAVEAARTQTGRVGEGTPTDLGPPDAPGAGFATGPSTSADLPDGHRLVVSGHRPPELGGYGSNPTAHKARSRLAEVLAAKKELHPDLIVLSGLGLGAEQLAAEAAADVGVPYVAVLPYPDPDSLWPASAKEHHRRLVDGARATVVLQARPPTSKATAGAALRRRDAWLARAASEAVVVWDGHDPIVGRLVRSLQDALGEDDVWVVPVEPGAVTPPTG